MSLATRAMFSGAIPDAPPRLGDIAPSGSRTTISSSAYMAFPAVVLDGDDLRLMYRYGTAHVSGASSIDGRISADLGLTWGSSAAIAGPSPSDIDLRDPCLLRLASGRLFVAYTFMPDVDGDAFEAYTRYSDDAGATWSTPDLALPTPYSGPLVSFASGQPVEVGGDVIVTGYAEDGGPWFAVLWRSSDGGETFGDPEVIASHGTRDYNECQLRVLDSGRWLVLMRSESNHHTWRTYSDDAGATWSTPANVNAMTGRPDFVEYRPHRLVQFGRFDTVGDSPGHYAVSHDDGSTWADPVEIDAGETDLAMYFAPVVVEPGTVVVVGALESSSSACGLYRWLFTD